jgi:hypothetical protein
MISVKDIFVAVHGLELEVRNLEEMTHASPQASVYASQLRLDKTQGKARTLTKHDGQISNF